MKKIIALFLISIMLLSPLSVLGASNAFSQSYSTEPIEGEIVIPISEKSGDWKASTAVKNYDGGSHLWTSEKGASVTFNIPKMSAGDYDVYFWVCPHALCRETMEFDINHVGRTSYLSVYQKLLEGETTAPGWVNMGTLDFSGDGTESIVHTCPGGNSRVGAIKLVPAKKHQFLITGKAVYNTALALGLATEAGATYKNYGHYYTSKGTDKFSKDIVSLHINVPYTGDYYVFSDVRTYDPASGGGTDSNRSFGMDVVQKGKVQKIHKYNSTDRFWFGSFQGQTDGFVSDVNSGAGFVSPHTIHLEKGEAVLNLYTKNSWTGFAFLAFAEEGSYLYNAIQPLQIDTSANSFYAQNHFKIYRFGSGSGSFYTRYVAAFADMTPPTAPVVSGVYDGNVKGAVLTVTDSAAEPVLGYIVKNGEQSGFYAKKNASAIPMDLSDSTTVTACAVDGAGNISDFSAPAVYTEAANPFATFEIENQNVSPQTFLVTTKGDNTFLTNRMTVKSGASQKLFAVPVTGENTENLTTLLFDDGFKPLREKQKYGADYTPKSATYAYEVDTVAYSFDTRHEKNIGTYRGSSLEGYMHYSTHYCNDKNATAVYDCFIPVTGKYNIYYYIPMHPETTALQYSWTLDNASGTIDALANQGLVLLGEFELSKGAKEFVIKKDYGTYLRTCAVVIEPQLENMERKNTKEVFGFDAMAQKATPDLSVIGTNDMTLTCDTDQNQVLWVLDMAQLSDLKEEFPDGVLRFEALGAQIALSYGEADIQSAFDAVNDGVNPVYLKIMMQRETVAGARSAVAAAVYTQCGEQYKATPKLASVSYTGVLDDTAVFAKIQDGNQSAVQTTRTMVSNDGTQNISAEIENHAVYAAFNELPALKALDGSDSPVSPKEFCDILYGVIGETHNQTDTGEMTVQKACTFVADALEKSGKRIISLADPKTFLADMYPDAGTIYSGYVDAVFKTVESGVLRGNGVDNLNPYDVLTGDMAYDMLSAFIALPEFVSPIKENPDAWELVFSDEFNGTEINTDVWQLATGGYSGHIASLRSADDQMVENGYLKLLIHKGEWTRTVSVTNDDGTTEKVDISGNWNSGHMWTKKTAFYSRYGYYEAMYRYPLGKTPYCNNSFWLCSIGGPYLELDINEGRMPSKIQMNMHWNHYYDEEGNLIPVEGGRTSTGGSAYVPRDLSQNFHRYGLYWDTDTLIWYFDGVPLREFALEGRGDFDVAVYFSVAIMKIKDSNGKVLSPSEFEAYEEEFGDLDGKSMDVEYVRVYQPKSAQ
ncbi:MAG: family 16 glycosylhydrolase [Clostridia bacterium]|nr:family 16 glycosylhydrolase [Clostridia bacterium]